MVCVAPRTPMRIAQDMAEATLAHPRTRLWLATTNMMMSPAGFHVMLETQRRQMVAMQEWQRAWAEIWIAATMPMIAPRTPKSRGATTTAPTKQGD